MYIFVSKLPQKTCLFFVALFKSKFPEIIWFNFNHYSKNQKPQLIVIITIKSFTKLKINHFQTLNAIKSNNRPISTYPQNSHLLTRFHCEAPNKNDNNLLPTTKFKLARTSKTVTYVMNFAYALDSYDTYTIHFPRKRFSADEMHKQSDKRKSAARQCI